MVRIALIALIALVCAVPASAQQYPDRPVTMLAGYPAGGLIDIVGSGVFAGKQFGIGTYVFDVCFTTTATGHDYAGTARFTMRSGAKLRGTIVGSTSGGPPPFYPFTVTGGTRRFRHATGTLNLGGFTETNQTNCSHGICTEWTDTGPITGTLRHVRIP